MGFSSMDDLISEITVNGKYNQSVFQKLTVNAAASAAGRWHELFTASGIPAAGALTGAAGAAVAMTSATAGAISAGSAAVTPDTMHVLNVAAWSPTATLVPAVAVLCDFLLYYPAAVVTGTPTALNNTVTLPRSTNGVGVMAIAAVTSALGATAPTLTFSYTDDAGNTGNSGVITAPAASAPLSTLFQAAAGGPFLPLAAGDRGIRKIDSYTLATGTTGTVAIILVKPIMRIPLLAINTATERDLLAQVPSLPKVEDGACLGWLIMPGGAMAANSSFQGYLDTAWG